MARAPRLAIVGAMKISWISICLLALSACKSESADPADVESAAPAEEATTAVEQAPSEGPSAAGTEAPAAAPDPNAPADLAAPPSDAQRTQSGLASKVLKKGKGKRRPGKLDTVTVNYTGWTSEGRRFDTTETRGHAMVVPVNHLIFGFAEGVRMMVPGEKRRLWVPGKLAYGEKGKGEDTLPQQPLGMLVFDVELVAFKKAPELPSAPKDVGQVPADASRSESGLAWRLLKEGIGTEHPIGTGVVLMDFTAWTADGEVFDSSILRGGRDSIGVSRLIPGWQEGMKLMVEGERRLFWIPEELAYQGNPHRPSGMVVVDVTLFKISKTMHQVR